MRTLVLVILAAVAIFGAVVAMQPADSEVGEGRLTIVQSRPNELVQIRREFERGLADMKAVVEAALKQ